MGAFKDELNRMGFIRVDFILRDVLTEGAEVTQDQGYRSAVQVMTVWAGADFVVRMEQCYQKIIIPSASGHARLMSG